MCISSCSYTILNNMLRILSFEGTIRPKALFVAKEQKIAQYINAASVLEQLDTKDCHCVNEVTDL